MSCVCVYSLQAVHAHVACCTLGRPALRDKLFGLRSVMLRIRRRRRRRRPPTVVGLYSCRLQIRRRRRTASLRLRFRVNFRRRNQMLARRRQITFAGLVSWSGGFLRRRRWRNTTVAGLVGWSVGLLRRLRRRRLVMIRFCPV